MKAKKAKRLAVLSILCVVLLAAYIVLSSGGTDPTPEDTALVRVEQPAELQIRLDSVSYDLFIEDGLWYCEQYPGSVIETSFINGLVQKLNEMTAVNILDNYGSLSRYGLDNASEYIRITQADGKELVLSVGTRLPDDEGLYLIDGVFVSVAYVYNSATDRVFTTYLDFAEYAGKDITEIVRLDEPKGFKNGDVSDFTIRYDGSQYTMARGSDGNWHAQKDGKAMDLSSQSIEEALRKIHYVYPKELAAVTASQADLESFGLLEPYLDIEINFSSGDVMTLRLGDLGYIQEDTYNAKRYMIFSGSQQVLLCYDQTLENVLAYITGENAQPIQE